MDAFEKKCMETIWYCFKRRHLENKAGRLWARQIIEDYAGYIRLHRKHLAEINSGSDL
jgi:hypothetical protein